MYIPSDPCMVRFESRDRRSRGDCGTYVRHNEDGTYTVKRAQKGALTPEYAQEIADYCADFGVEFSAIGRGKSQNFEDSRPRKFIATRTDSGLFGWYRIGEFTTRQEAIDAASADAPWSAHTELGVSEYVLTRGEWVKA